MNKRIIKICITLVVLTALASTQIFSVSAAIRPIYKGDVNDSGKVDIDDVTLLQKYIIGLEELNKEKLWAADVNEDNKYTVDDVTMIQKYCSGIIKSFNTQYAWRDVQIKNFYSDYDSGKATVGTPITFCAEAYGQGTLTYKYYVNDVLVSESTDSNRLTYTFDEAGFYKITVRIYNVFDNYCEYDKALRVVEEYPLDKPVISSMYFDDLNIQGFNSTVLTANAVGGTAPYEFKFSIGDGLYVQDYSEDNTFDLEPYMYNPYIDFIWKNHTIVVTVRDASGQTATESMEFFAS